MKIKYGMLAGALSGSQGNTTASHNRYGAYLRERVIPTKVSNEFTLQARGRLIDVSQSWGALTAAQMLSWNTWAQSNPITDRLGDKQVLTGHAAFVQLNARLLVSGSAKILVPPSEAAPLALATTTVTYNIGAGTSTIAFTATPLAAGLMLWTEAAVLTNPGQRYWANRMKLVKVSAAALASPYDYQADVEDRFGPLVVGQRLVTLCRVFDSATGLISAPLIDEGVIITT